MARPHADVAASSPGQTAPSRECARLVQVFVTSTAPAASFGPSALALLRRLSTEWPADTRFHVAISADAGDPLAAHSFDPFASPSSRGWRTIASAFRAGAYVVGGSSSPRNSFELNELLFDEEPRDEPAMQTLCVSMDLVDRVGRSPAAVAARVDRVRAHLDDVLRDTPCTQAFVEVAPTSEGRPRRTRYERSRRILGPLLQRSWGTRYLRAVSGDGMWLSTELWPRLDQLHRAAVARVAEVVAIRPGLIRLMARDADLPALERALAPLLPPVRYSMVKW